MPNGRNIAIMLSISDDTSGSMINIEIEHENEKRKDKISVILEYAMEKISDSTLNRENPIENKNLIISENTNRRRQKVENKSFGEKCMKLKVNVFKRYWQI
ncbi:Hypothetical protein CINCED_3A021283 [Cinara cedri]|uniref:Uncharacterized protein n=1 Tax=Cinara cedri TaxID=506608 RepID=A0A5E4N917_9HEMI|nr:Hypothetical protein CINCED_3A021283 [Cinara cedri]